MDNYGKAAAPTGIRRAETEAPRERPPTTVQVDRLQEAVSAIGSLINMLEDRLQPILVQEPKGPPSAAGVHGGVPPIPLVEALSAECDRLEALQDTLRNILNRVGV